VFCVVQLSVAKRLQEGAIFDFIIAVFV